MPENNDIDREKRLYEAMQTAEWFLKRRLYSAHDLKVKLLQKGIPDDLLNDVIAECKRRRYLNDESAAEYYFEEFKRRCYGPRYIWATMKKHGLSAELIDETFQKYKDRYDEMQIADDALRKKKAGIWARDRHEKTAGENAAVSVFAGILPGHHHRNSQIF
jgi:SOS response regulatory protein OraA/RecX